MPRLGGGYRFGFKRRAHILGVHIVVTYASVETRRGNKIFLQLKNFI